MVEEVIKLLEGTKPREALAKCWQEFVNAGDLILSTGVEEWGVQDHSELIDLAFDSSGFPYEPLEVMWQEVQEKTPLPHIITATELSDALWSLLPRDESALKDDYGPENFYPAFLNCVRSLLTHRASRPFAIAQLPVRARSERTDAVTKAFGAGVLSASAREKDEPIDEEARQTMVNLLKENDFEIWSGNGISVGLCGTGRPDIDPEFAQEPFSESRDLLYARVCGRISPRAMRSLAQELRGVIRSLVRSSLVAADADPHERWLPDAPTELPIASAEVLKRETSFVRMCVQSYFAKPRSKKDSLDRRIRNAVTLLVEADAQSNDAVGMALAVTAIEALLGAGKTEIAATLCDGVATLLEPDRKQRSVANEFMKRVYDDRSRVLHGVRIDAAQERRKDIRLLAGGVLYAVVNRVDCLRRSGYEPQTPDELRKEIKDLKYSPGQPMGVPELPRVCNLWRKVGQQTL